MCVRESPGHGVCVCENLLDTVRVCARISWTRCVCVRESPGHGACVCENLLDTVCVCERERKNSLCKFCIVCVRSICCCCSGAGGSRADWVVVSLHSFCSRCVFSPALTRCLCSDLQSHVYTHLRKQHIACFCIKCNLSR